MPPSSETDPEASVLGAELRQDLTDAIQALPPRLALVVVAHVLDGREVKSIAADFGVTPSRVSQLCGEALLLLRSDDTSPTPHRDPPDSRRPVGIEADDLAPAAHGLPRARCATPATGADSSGDRRWSSARRRNRRVRVTARAAPIRRSTPRRRRRPSPRQHDVGPARPVVEPVRVDCPDGSTRQPASRGGSLRRGRLSWPVAPAPRPPLPPHPLHRHATTPR